MKSEIEAKFLAVDPDTMRQKLTELGGKCDQPMRLLRRYVIETPDMGKRNAYLRVRDEGNAATMTYKQFDELSIDGAKEIEISVSDFDATMELLKTAFPVLNRASYQESKRETWRLKDCEVVLDEWPWVKAYVEVEGPSEESVRVVSAKLGFEWGEAVFGDVMAAYRAEYPHLTLNDTVGSVDKVMFDDPLPDLLKSR